MQIGPKAQEWARGRNGDAKGALNNQDAAPRQGTTTFALRAAVSEICPRLICFVVINKERILIAQLVYLSL